MASILSILLVVLCALSSTIAVSKVPETRYALAANYNPSNHYKSDHKSQWQAQASNTAYNYGQNYNNEPPKAPEQNIQGNPSAPNDQKKTVILAIPVKLALNVPDKKDGGQGEERAESNQNGKSERHQHPRDEYLEETSSYIDPYEDDDSKYDQYKGDNFDLSPWKEPGIPPNYGDNLGGPLSGLRPTSKYVTTIKSYPSRLNVLPTTSYLPLRPKYRPSYILPQLYYTSPKTTLPNYAALPSLARPQLALPSLSRPRLVMPGLSRPQLTLPYALPSTPIRSYALVKPRFTPVGPASPQLSQLYGSGSSPLKMYLPRYPLTAPGLAPLSMMRRPLIGRYPGALAMSPLLPQASKGHPLVSSLGPLYRKLF